MNRDKVIDRVLSVCLWVLTLLILVPIYMVVVNSGKSKTEAAMMNMALPSRWQLVENYLEMIKEGGVLRGFRNSVFITLVCVFVLITCCSAMAFVLQRKKTTFSRIINMVVIFGLVIPLQIIPTYLLCNFLHLGHILSGILVLIVANMSFTVFLYTGYIKGIPSEIDESAWLDGANQFQLFFRIIFPLLQPVTITAVIINFMAVWNDFGNAIYFFNSSQNYTLPLTIYNFIGNHGSDWQLVFANVVFATLPVLIVYLCLQKYIIAGMTAGSVKG